jgi:hypothetical protein
VKQLRGRALLLAVLAVLAAAGAAGCEDGPAPVDAQFAAFLDGWRKADFGGNVDLRTPQGRALDAAAAKETLAGIEGDLAARRPTLTPRGKAVVDHADATLTVGVSWPLPGGRTWAYDTKVAARMLGQRWQVYLGPETVHPGLQAGQRLTLRSTPAKRGIVVAGDGTPIVSEVPVVYVGVEPQRVPDVAALVQRLEIVFRSVRTDVDVQGLPARIKAAKPDAFVDVVTLRKSDHAEIAADLSATDGVRTREGTLSLPMTRTFGRALLGTSGPATKELIDGSDGTLKAGDVAGLTGLQRRYDKLLRGLPGLTVVPVEPAAGTTAAKAGPPLFTAPPQDGGTVATTLDVRVQQAAEAALARTDKQSALVAIRITDGAVLAVANGPGAAGYDLALRGEIPDRPASAWPTDPASLGIGAPWRIGADVFPGRIGADGVVAAPIGYAAASAALARGMWRQPVLVKTPEPGEPGPAGPPVAGTLALPGKGLGVSRHGDIAYCVYVAGGDDVIGTVAETFVGAIRQ